MKRLSDYQLRESLRQQYHTAFGGRYTGFIDALINFFLRAIPLSVKIFTRKDIGSMTFSWGTIILAALWARFILEGYPNFEGLESPETLSEAMKNNHEILWITFQLSRLVIIAIQFFTVIIDFIPFSILSNPEQVDGPSFFYPILFSYAIIYVGAVHMEQISKKHIIKIRFDPLNPGNNIIIATITKIASVVGLKNNPVVKLLAKYEKSIEIVLLVFLTYFLWENAEESEFLKNMAWFIGLGTVALFFENRSIKRQIRREVEARFATEIRAEQVEAAYQEFMIKKENEIATVSYLPPDYEYR